MQPAFKMLARVSKIQSQDYSIMGCAININTIRICRFSRPIGHASGFQSIQDRLIEWALGYKKKGNNQAI